MTRSKCWLSCAGLRKAAAVLKCACSIILLCSCTSIEPREALVIWPQSCDKGPIIIHVISTPTPTLDCIAHQPPARAGIDVFMTLLGAPPMACSFTAGGYNVIYVNTNMGAVSEQMTVHEIEHAFGMEHPFLFPLAHSCAKD